MKLLILGNSLTRHAPAPQIGWHGDWGMAASTREHDFVHRLCTKLEEAGVTVDLRFGNVADFERNPAQNHGAYFADDLAFAPDVLVLRICENTPADKYAEFAAAYEALIRSFCKYRPPRARCTAKQSHRAAQIAPPSRTPEPLQRTGAPQHRNPAGSFPPP